MLAECTKAMPERDFLLSRQGLPLGYAMMLAQFRRCLALYGGVPPDRVGGFSLHSCKATSLGWALQLALPLDLRAAQGHRRLPNQCVAKYGRDDVWPQLRCQRRIISPIGNGWRPAVPLHRGVICLTEDASKLEEMGLQHNELTESESEGELRSDGVEEPATDWDVEDDCPPSDAEDVAADIDSTEVQGPWIRLGASGISMDRRFHRRRWGPLGPNWYVFYTQDPRVDGFHVWSQRLFCGHVGCQWHCGGSGVWTLLLVETRNWPMCQRIVPGIGGALCFCVRWQPMCCLPRDWRCSGAMPNLDRLQYGSACSEIGGALLQGAEASVMLCLCPREFCCAPEIGGALGCVRDWWCPGAGSIWKSSSMVADRCLLRDWWCSVARCRLLCYTCVSEIGGSLARVAQALSISRD